MQMEMNSIKNTKWKCKANNEWVKMFEVHEILIEQNLEQLKRPTLARHCVISIMIKNNEL